MIKSKIAIPFTKMHGTGNDYIYINAIQHPISNAPKLAKNMSQAHYGVGSDGLILIQRGKEHPFKMEMYNANGSQAEMCGNGLRCMAKYLYDEQLIKDKQFFIETGKGNLFTEIHTKNNEVNEVSIHMGSAIFQADQIPILTDAKSPILNESLTIDHQSFLFSSVSIGNPHCVIFLDSQDSLKLFPVDQIGPKIQKCSLFPRGVNVEFVKQISRKILTQRTWERGSGETLSCGTGACASVVVSILQGKTDNKVEVKLSGGTLNIEYNIQDNDIVLKGPAKKIFDGIYYLENGLIDS